MKYSIKMLFVLTLFSYGLHAMKENQDLLLSKIDNKLRNDLISQKEKYSENIYKMI